MSKDHNSTSSPGFLSKVVKFVSNPTRDWKELDSLHSAAEEDPSEQLVRERIERKRRNDFIRRSEFAQLRKIINARKKQRQPQVSPSIMAKLASSAAAVRSEGEQALNTIQSRSGTLQKINEIEEQLSKQWWQGQPGGSPGTKRPATLPEASAGEPQEGASDFFLADGDSLFFADAVIAQVQRARQKLARQVADALAPAEEDPVIARLRAIEAMWAHFGFEEDFVHQADLEEASILFASNRVADAEKVLVDVIRKHAGADPAAQVDIWMTLFDLYRATGQQERFDAVAIDFAKRFGRTAPVWISLPEQLGVPDADAVAKRHFSWTSPPDVTPQTMATVAALQGRAAAPYQFNWTRLKSIQPDAVEALRELIETLNDQSGAVQFTGGEQLLALVQAQTPTGDAAVPRAWWQLRLALLRLFGQAEPFEEAALDYTVTYEESPPAWRPPQASYQGEGHAAGAGATLMATGRSEQAAPELHKAALEGRVENDATEVLDHAVAELPADAPVAIDCSRLLSIDFPAAGSVLNWAAQQQSQGRAVAFTNVHRLVAVFFNVVGINELARIVPRKN
ncbi:STAS domain-containing protein [Corticibacter populi]|uniref:STAS domain-containing protein n=1 Tax=Corticibacter populi TaxID=1550736 RepID=A0A3M6QLY2_9BURK|nr:STAS domain-containing protein [Corticibacter populi]RMX04066.1 STAS domain-containing protein [Corticibacter populi]RZS33070.1 STAS domain-containing protein [Corticibacter populi]